MPMKSIPRIIADFDDETHVNSNPPLPDCKKTKKIKPEVHK